MERSAVGSLLRTSQAFCQQICEKQTLDFGIAYFSTKFPLLPEANQLREVTLADADKISAAFEQANAFFSSRSITCLRWSPAIDIDPKPLEAFLHGRKFITRVYDVYRLEKWSAPDAPSGARILPARAMRGALYESFLQSAKPDGVDQRRQLAESFLERLDDPQLDMFVALLDKQPVGRCGLYQVGDIARVLDLSVLPAFSSRGVDSHLLAHVLSLAKRLTMPMVVAQVAGDDAARRELMIGTGFVKDGQVFEFEIPTSFAEMSPP